MLFTLRNHCQSTWQYTDQRSSLQSNWWAPVHCVQCLRFAGSSDTSPSNCLHRTLLINLGTFLSAQHFPKTARFSVLCNAKSVICRACVDGFNSPALTAHCDRDYSQRVLRCLQGSRSTQGTAYGWIYTCGVLFKMTCSWVGHEILLPMHSPPSRSAVTAQLPQTVPTAPQSWSQNHTIHSTKTLHLWLISLLG